MEITGVLITASCYQWSNLLMELLVSCAKVVYPLLGTATGIIQNFDKITINI